MTKTQISTRHQNTKRVKSMQQPRRRRRRRRRLTFVPSNIITTGLLVFFVVDWCGVPSGINNGVQAKGLVGKLPGAPASCPEEPCNSDPQHVLTALKWTSLGFLIILLLPIVFYYLSKLFTKLGSMCCRSQSLSSSSSSSLAVDKSALRETIEANNSSAKNDNNNRGKSSLNQIEFVQKSNNNNTNNNNNNQDVNKKQLTSSSGHRKSIAAVDQQSRPQHYHHHHHYNSHQQHQAHSRAYNYNNHHTNNNNNNTNQGLLHGRTRSSLADLNRRRLSRVADIEIDVYNDYNNKNDSNKNNNNDSSNRNVNNDSTNNSNSCLQVTGITDQRRQGSPRRRASAIVSTNPPSPSILDANGLFTVDTGARQQHQQQQQQHRINNEDDDDDDDDDHDNNDPRFAYSGPIESLRGKRLTQRQHALLESLMPTPILSGTGGQNQRSHQRRHSRRSRNNKSNNNNCINNNDNDSNCNSLTDAQQQQQQHNMTCDRLLPLTPQRSDPLTVDQNNNNNDCGVRRTSGPSNSSTQMPTATSAMRLTTPNFNDGCAVHRHSIDRSTIQQMPHGAELLMLNDGYGQRRPSCFVLTMNTATTTSSPSPPEYTNERAHH